MVSENTAMSKVGHSLASTIRSDIGASFTKANDRFVAPTKKRQSPSPNAYRIPDTVGWKEASISMSPFSSKKMGKTVFGRERRDY